MLVKCRECGEMISSLAKSCPHCGCPAESHLSRIRNSVSLGCLATSKKSVLHRFRIRTPWSLIVPSMLANVLFSVLIVACTIYECERASIDFSLLVLMWGIWLAFVAMNLAVMRGSRAARVWLIVGMAIWLLTRMLFNPLSFFIVAVIEVPWVCALCSRSAQRWFEAHKRLDGRRRKSALHGESRV